MAKVSLVKGTTSYLSRIFIQDSSSTVGAGLAGLTSSSAGLVCSRARDDDGNAGAVVITLSAGTRGTWSSGGFVEKDSTNQKGVYELGIPNAALATGSNSVIIYLFGATNMAPCVLEIELTGWNNQDAVHGGLSALPNTAVTTNASLITSGTGTDQLQVAAGLASANEKQINGVSTSSVTTVNANVGTTQPVNFSGTGASALVKGDTEQLNAQTVTAAAGVTFPSSVASPTNITAGTITTVSGNVNGSVGSVTAAVTIAAGQLLIKKNTALSNFPFVMTDSTNHNPATGLTVSCTIKIDAGSYAASTNAPTAVANGIYQINFAAADLNGTVIGVRMTATGADDLNWTFITQA